MGILPFNNYLQRCCCVIIAKAAAAFMDMERDFVPAQPEEFRNAFEPSSVEKCIRMIERKVDELKYIPLNVAVMGNSGVGKSSFVNSIRGVTADDEGAAPVGVKETTLVIRDYSHPSHPLLKFWDLPGVGSNIFKRETYLSDINVDRYDFFLLITADRFTQDDTWLGEELHKRNKDYFFVRTKVGLDISNNKKAHPKTHNEDAVVREIRESTKEHLTKNGFPDVQVFLIDSYKVNKFDFDQLERRLIEEFPNLKRRALVLSLKANCKEIIQLEVAKCRSRMWKIAGISALLATVRSPWQTVIFDYVLVANEAAFCSMQLGLDKTSLKRYTKLTSADYQNSILYHVSAFKANLDPIAATDETSAEDAVPVVTAAADAATVVTAAASAAPVVTAAADTAHVVIAEALEKFYSFISPTFCYITAPVSFGGTYYALKLVLDEMESAAVKYVTAAVETAAAKITND